MLNVLVLICYILRAGYGLQCSQLSTNTMSTAIGLLRSLNMSFWGLNDDDLRLLSQCVQSAPELSSLQSLDLQGNRLSGQNLSTLLDQLPDLQYISLKSNPIVELDRDLFRSTRQLRFLDISEVPLRALAPALLYPVSDSLLYLAMAKTELHYIPGGFFGAESGSHHWPLTNLNLSGNLLLSSLPDDMFQHLTSLESMDVSSSGISCCPPRHSSFLSILPRHLADCQSPMRRRLQAIPQTFMTERTVFRLDLDFSALTQQGVLNTISSLISDISKAVGISPDRIVNVQLGPSALSSTIVQLDILDNDIPAAKQVVELMRNQSMMESSPLRAGLVTSHIIVSSSVISMPAQVRQCSSTLFVDVKENCPVESQSSSIFSNSQVWISCIIVACLGAILAMMWIIRATARQKAEKRLRNAMQDVINLSLGQEIDTSTVPHYKAISPSVEPAHFPSRPPTSSPETGPKSDEFAEADFRERPKPPLVKAPSTVTLVKRPGLNAIRSKKLLLIPSVDGDESMMDTDAEF